MASKFYAVRVGRTPGIYETWAECQKQTTGFKGAIFKSFLSKEEALGFVGDVLTEIWGYKTAKKVIYLTFICNLIMTLATYIGVLLPGASYLSEVNNAYEVIFTYTPRILIASLIAFLLGELTNAKVMELVKKATKEKYLFIRTILSSMAGYIFDTGVFVILAFYGTCKLGDLFTMIIVQYFIKVIIEAILATPLAYLIVGYLKKC